MQNLETNRITLRPIDEKDNPILHKWRNEERFLMLFSNRRNFVGFDKFVLELKRDFETGRHLQFIVELKNGSIPIGTIYSFDLSLVDGYAFINAYIDQAYERRGYGAEAVSLLVEHLFRFFPIRKIYFEVFAYNTLSLSTLTNGNFKEEGRFKEHRFFNGAWHDVIRFAVYRSANERIEKLLERFRSRRVTALKEQ